MTELSMKTDARALRLEPDLRERRLKILTGISRDLTDSEIASQLGVDRWTVLRDMRSMRHNNDLGLKDAVDARDEIRAGKAAVLMQTKAHVRQEKMFLNMTGMTLQEKSFQNMIDFHMSELTKIMKATDQGAAIRALPKRARRTLLNNGILENQHSAPRSWRIAESAQKYLVSLSRKNSAATP